MQIIDGKALSSKIRAEISAQVAELKSKGVEACLAVILVGNDPSSELYVRNKVKASEEVGIKKYSLPLSLDRYRKGTYRRNRAAQRRRYGQRYSGATSFARFYRREKGNRAYRREQGRGRIFRIPDGFTVPRHARPCALHAAGDHRSYRVDGRRNRGETRRDRRAQQYRRRPTLQLLLQRDATVTICHSKTQNLKEFTKTADILVVAVGKPRFITKDMVKDGAVVIDVGISRDENGKLSGDVDFENVKDVCSFITPVPGGVGPMTVTMLMHNTLLAAKRR